MKSSLHWHMGSAIVAVVGLCFGPIAVAEIQVTPRLQVRQSWTDTANLDVAGTNGDFITTISPGVNISGTTNRVQMFIDYTLNGLVFWKQNENSDIRHQLNAAVNTEVLRDRFFVDIRGNIQQQFQDFGGQISNVRQNFTQNRRTIQSYSISPRWQEQFGNVATATLRYSFNVIEQELEGATGSPVGFSSDGIGHQASLTLASGTRFDRLNWNWTTRYQTNNRTFNDLRFESFRSVLDLSYNLSRTIALLGSGGYEEISDDTLIQNQEGAIWDVGLRFTPGPRTTVEGRVGERFGGTVFSASATYRFNQTDTISASYEENLTVPGRFQGNRLNNVGDLDGDGIPDFLNPGDEIIGSDALNTDLAFRQKRGNITVSRNLPKTTIALQAFWQERQFPSANNFTNEGYGASLSGQYRIDRAQSVAASLIYRKDQFANIPNNSGDFIAFSPSYNFAISRNLNASARYNFTKRISDNPFLDRTTNSVSLALTATF